MFREHTIFFITNISCTTLIFQRFVSCELIFFIDLVPTVNIFTDLIQRQYDYI